MTENAAQSETFEFRAEIQQLLNILVHSLYTEREIFLRELISNASDALHRLQFEMLTNQEVVDPAAELAIHIESDAQEGTLTVRDTGVGMTREELVENLGMIAHSGAAALLKTLQEQERQGLDLIGQFGVGFYSVFMVAEEVTVTSRSYRPDTVAYAWIADGTARYRMMPANKQERGTTVQIKLKPDAKEFAESWRLEAIVKKHSDFVAFPIYVQGKVVNRRAALWREPVSEISDEQYDEFYRHLTLDFEKPLLHMHMVADAPVDIHALLFIPSRQQAPYLAAAQEHGLRLYMRRVLIRERFRDLLPAYLRFVEGVVDSEDLPLNISRESVQTSPAVRQIQRALVGRLLKELNTLAEEQPDDYRRFWELFGVYIKEGVASDASSRADLATLLRYGSSKAEGDELTSLAAYVSRMQEDQQEIYYVSGDDLASLIHSPHLDYFRQHDLEVLYMVEPIDSFVVASLREFDGKPLRAVDDPELSLPQEKPQVLEPEADRAFERLRGRFVDVLGKRITEVRASRMLVSNPIRLVVPKELPSRDMQRMYKMLNRDYEVPRMVIELNPGHPLIHRLAQMVAAGERDEVVNTIVEQLYGNALLAEGLHPNPAEMVPQNLQLLETLLAAPAGGETGEEE